MPDFNFRLPVALGPFLTKNTTRYLLLFGAGVAGVYLYYKWSRSYDRNIDDLIEVHSYPFLNDEKTIAHISKSKVFFILRGLPGSGKSTIGKEIYKKYPGCVVCSADSYHYNQEGVYDFKVENLPVAHSTCKRLTSNACENGIRTIVIDNTNIVWREIKPYIYLANDYNYFVVIVEPHTSWAFNAKELFEKTIHNVPLQTIETRLMKYKDIKPLYFAWFINTDAAETLKDITLSVFSACMTHVCDFKKFYELQSSSSVGNTSQFEQIYTKSINFNYLHVTSFCIANKGFGLDYEHYKEKVRESMGKCFELEIVGIMFTPRTACARVRLSNQELCIWNQDDFQNNLFQQECSHISADSNSLHPTCGYGSRAHITLGVNEPSKNVQSGLDLIEIINFEDKMMKKETFQGFDKGLFRYFDEGRAMFYFDKPFLIPSIFSAHY